MRLKSIILSTIAISYSLLSSGQYTTNDSIISHNIGKFTLEQGIAYQHLHNLCKKIGHRLSGSTASYQAIEWAKKTLLESGADTVWLQPAMVPVWERGQEKLQIQFKKNYVDVPVLSLGNTEGTKGKTLNAEIVIFNSLDELKNASTDKIKGKIVFLNVVFPKNVYSTFEGYGQIASNRRYGVNMSSQKGALGFILRSISTSKNDLPHTGMSHYDDGVNPIPAVAIGNVTADKLVAALKNKTVTAKLTSNCTMKGMKLSYNVIGELRGRKNPNEYIVVGGHLDSWDVGEGAHDDGAGCVQSIQVLHTLTHINYQPNNTIRVVLFMNEENGNKGGITYADSVASKNEKHIFALESDAGGFTPRGIGMIVPEEYRTQAKSWSPILQKFGLFDFAIEGCGVDVSPMKKLNIKVGELIPDSQRYFDFHHNNADVFEAVNERELLMGAAGMTTFIYLVDQYWK